MTLKSKQREHEARLAQQGYRYRKFKVHDDDYDAIYRIIQIFNAKHKEGVK